MMATRCALGLGLALLTAACQRATLDGVADQAAPSVDGSSDAALPASDAALPTSDAALPTSDAALPANDAASASVRPAYNTGTGFYVGADHQLYDANGQRFRMRGVNRVHYDDGAATAIVASGANAVRWLLYWGNGTTAAQFVTQLTNENYDHGIVAIPGVWTTSNDYGHAELTCNQSAANLTHAVDEWVAQVAEWKTIEKWAIINIANEWGPSDSTTWRDSYITAVTRMRTAGYRHTLMIDSGGCGQDPNDLIKYGQAVLDADPEHNIVFSIHIYGNTQAGQAATRLDALAATGLPLVIGEFGPGRDIGPSPTDLTPGELIGAADARDIGWLAWAWDDNNLANSMSNDGWFAMVYDNSATQVTADTLTQFGDDVVLDATYGIKTTAARATIFP